METQVKCRSVVVAEVVQKTSQENFAMYMALDANVFKICKDVVICASASTVVTHMVTTGSLLNIEWKEKEKGIITHLDHLLNFYM